MTRHRGRLLAALLLSVVALGGCGDSPEDDPEADLRARAQLVRTAVETRDPETARSALNGLREAAIEHRRNGDLEFERAQAIITAANHVEEHLGELDRLPPEEGDDPEAEADATTTAEPDPAL